MNNEVPYNINSQHENNQPRRSNTILIILSILLVIAMFVIIYMFIFKKEDTNNNNNNNDNGKNNVSEKTDAEIYSESIIDDELETPVPLYYDEKGMAALSLTIDSNGRLAVYSQTSEEHLISNLTNKVKTLNSVSGCSADTSTVYIITEDGDLYFIKVVNAYDDLVKLYNSIDSISNLTPVRIDAIEKVSSDDKIVAFTDLFDGPASCGKSGFYVLTDKDQIRRVEENQLTNVRWDGHLSARSIGVLYPEIFVYSNKTIKLNRKSLISIVNSKGKEYKIDQVIYDEFSANESKEYIYLVTEDKDLLYLEDNYSESTLTKVTPKIYGKKVDTVNTINTAGKDEVVITFEDGTKLQTGMQFIKTL